MSEALSVDGMALDLDSPARSCCLVVPLYRPCLTEDEALSLVITHARAVGVAALKILHPPAIAGFVARLQGWFSKEHPDRFSFESLEVPSEYFQGVSAYSKLLLSEFFYELLVDYEWLFIVQLDALLLSDQLVPWLSMPYSYIGAPWFVGLDQPIKPLQPLGGGNGGFSLRRIADCLDVLRYRGNLYRPLRRMERITLPHQRWRAEIRACRHISTHSNALDKLDLFEDVFWSFVAPEMNSRFSVAPFSVSASFAVETEPRFFFAQSQDPPLGCHGYRRHDPMFWDDLWLLNPELVQAYIEPAHRLADHLEGSQ